MQNEFWSQVGAAAACCAAPASEALIKAWLQTYPGDTREQVLKRMDEHQAKVELWRNDLYQAEVHRNEHGEPWVHINIRRIDGYVGRDWRHFQQIKNELVGPECEGIELYPAESRVVDTSNKYHLWCCTDPEFRFPCGWQQRNVASTGENEGGLRQAPPMQFKRERSA